MEKDKQLKPRGAHLACHVDDGCDQQSLPKDLNLCLSMRVLGIDVDRRQRDEGEVDAATRVLRRRRWRVDERGVSPPRLRLANEIKLLGSSLGHSRDALADAPHNLDITLLLAREIVEQLVETQRQGQLVTLLAARSASEL